MIRLENIYKYYYSESSVTQALRNVNLEFSKGEFVAITGESGSGKTTLLNVISGIDTYDEGEMYVNGQPTFQYDDDDWEAYRRNKIGFVFQNYNLIGHYTVLDNMISALLILGVGEKKAEKKALKYLEKVGLKGFEKSRASKLSSGQKQRLAIARALAKETDIIMADEPTGNLDSETGLQIIKLLAELSKEKLVIMVTHNYEQAQDYVTRKVKIHDGEIVLDVAVNTDKRINYKAEQPSDDKNADAGEKLRNQSKNTQVDLKDKKTGIEGADYIQTTTSIESYVSLCLTMFIIFGCVFEMPLVTIILSKMGIANPEILKKARGVAIVLIFFIAAVVTPPDIVSQCMVAIPMVLLYFVSIFLSGIFYKPRSEDGDEEDTEEEDED